MHQHQPWFLVWTFHKLTVKVTVRVQILADLLNPSLPSMVWWCVMYTALVIAVKCDWQSLGHSSQGQGDSVALCVLTTWPLLFLHWGQLHLHRWTFPGKGYCVYTWLSPGTSSAFWNTQLSPRSIADRFMTHLHLLLGVPIKPHRELAFSYTEQHSDWLWCFTVCPLWAAGRIGIFHTWRHSD